MPSDPPEPAAGPVRRRGRTIALVLATLAVGLGSWAVSLVLSAPATLLERHAPAQVRAVSGTLLSGRADLAGGHALEWRAEAGASFAALGPAGRWSLDGPAGTSGAATAMTGRAGWSVADGALRVNDVAGTLAWPLIAAAAPGLAVACDGAVAVETLRLELSETARVAEGRARSGPATCRGPGGSAELPALALRLVPEGDGARAELRRADAPGGEPLFEAALGPDDVLRLIVRPDGAALIPGMPTGGESRLEYPLR